MDLDDTPEQAAFRASVRAWMADNVPRKPWPEHGEELQAFKVAWHRKLYQGGWAGLSWPVEYGGKGLGYLEEAILQQEMGRAGAPQGPGFGYIGRAIMAHGTEEQKRRFLPKLLSSEELWCQGFSEPGAGSDLAGLRTRAVQDGDRFVVNGQKIWTSLAQFADYCFLLARTDPEAPKHKGISAFLVDMKTPGITARPILQISGDDGDFCEVFFDDAELPADALLGELNQGWTIANTTLVYERGPMEISQVAQLEAQLRRLAGEMDAQGRRDDLDTKRALGSAATALEVLRLRCLYALTDRVRGLPPGPEGSIEKLLMGMTEQRLCASALDLVGPDALAAEGGWFAQYLHGRAVTIYGGTAQIQKNILATRVLGLPR